MDISTPLNVSERSFVLENEASASTDVCTPIRFAVDPEINSELYTLKQCTGSVAPLAETKLILFNIYSSIFKGKQ